MKATRDVAFEQVPGVAPNLLSLDYYLPIRPAGCGAAPLVVFVHGGGFSRGDKANKISDKVNLLTGQGWAFASVNYRLSPASSKDLPGDIRYPVHEQDVATAVGWLRAHSATLGTDPSRIALIGHSSGAFLTSLLSTDTSFLTKAGVPIADVPCPVSLDTEYSIPKQIAHGGKQEALYRKAFGADPTTWAVGSPITHTEPGASRPRFLIVTQGKPDDTRRVDQAEAFRDALVAGGTPATVLDVSPLQHEEINAAVGASNEMRVTPPVVSFLQSCLAGSNGKASP